MLRVKRRIAYKLIVAPEEWIPRKDGYDYVDVLIPQPIKQKFIGSQGKYQINNIIKRNISSKIFHQLSNTNRFCPPHEPTIENMDLLERKYWKSIHFNPPIYGADINGSLYDETQNIWDLRNLGTILNHVADDYEACIDGVTTTYLYFGMWRSTFGWHTEDMDLYSINYLHYGAPKFWYSIPTQYSRRFEQLVKLYFGVESESCANFLRHKSTLISPTLLQRHNIPYNKIQQQARDFIITFPYAYHAGFNTGFNCAESTNFAMPRWIEYGKRAIQCDCRNNMVRFSMKCFVRRFQPDLLEAFEKGEDVAPHPEDNYSNMKLPSGKRGIQANPMFEDPTFIIKELNGLDDVDYVSSKRVPSRRQILADCCLDSSDEDEDYLELIRQDGNNQSEEKAAAAAATCDDWRNYDRSIDVDRYKSKKRKHSVDNKIFSGRKLIKTSKISDVGIITSSNDFQTLSRLNISQNYDNDSSTDSYESVLINTDEFNDPTNFSKNENMINDC